MARRIGKVPSKNTALFICAMQEKFRPTIMYYPQIINVASRLLGSAQALEMPVIVTEQYPKGLGPTVSELDVSQHKVFPKTCFSMIVPDVATELKKHDCLECLHHSGKNQHGRQQKDAGQKAGSPVADDFIGNGGDFACGAHGSGKERGQPLACSVLQIFNSNNSSSTPAIFSAEVTYGVVHSVRRALHGGATLRPILDGEQEKTLRSFRSGRLQDVVMFLGGAGGKGIYKIVEGRSIFG
ncbi:hypothetical protein EGW08_020339 [Elysia chlorotica]|uniref:Isochorismatase-like domain-containing protein n=1 Tax=Elysia chlorotica TaxID=188477 RepID=A0A3S1B4Q3_ELYCH|nr:hypothetical protein EGW08_020339 [Elysia chlorotica]